MLSNVTGNYLDICCDCRDLVCFVQIVTKLFYGRKSFGLKRESSSSFKQKVQNAFPKYTVLLRSQSVMICELDTRGQPEELVVIRIVPNASKSLIFKSRILVATYPTEPSVPEMKRDFQNLRNS